jgi:hypothetical protein
MSSSLNLVQADKVWDGNQNWEVVKNEMAFGFAYCFDHLAFCVRMLLGEANFTHTATGKGVGEVEGAG